MRYVRSIQLLAMICLCSAAQATVTYEGTDGTFATIFSPLADINPDPAVVASGCARVGCHDGANPDFRVYSVASVRVGTMLTYTRDFNPVDNPIFFMPQGGVSIGPALISLLEGWATATAPLNAAPSIALLNPAGITKTQATLSADVNDNGRQAVYQFEYGAGFSNEVTATSGATTGGGLINDTAMITISSLECGTDYPFRLRGTNELGTPPPPDPPSPSVPGVTVESGDPFRTLDCPTAIDQSMVPVDEGAAVTITLAGSDVANDTLAFEMVGTPDNGTLSAITTISPTQATVTYTHDGTENFSDSFTFNVSAGGSMSQQPATVSIIVEPVNDAPEAVSQAGLQVGENSTNVITLVATDVDDDDNTLTYSISTMPANGSLSPLNGATVTYTPNIDFADDDFFEFVATDDELAVSAPARVSIVVTNIRPPMAFDQDNVALDEDSSIDINLIASTDPMNDPMFNPPISSYVVSMPAHGVLSGVAPNLTYTPQQDYNGTDSFTFVAFADTFPSNTATVDITVNAVNDQLTLAPFNETVIVTELEMPDFIVDARSNLTDPDINDVAGETFSWRLTGEPQEPDLMTISADGIVLWTPGEDTAGEYPVTVYVRDDGENGTAEQSQTFTVRVNLLDTDSDLVADYKDSCPCLSNAESQNVDLDGDGRGDQCDYDVDGDGIHNVAEICNGLDAMTPNDPMTDSDGDGLTDLCEFNSLNESCAPGSVLSQCALVESDCPTSPVDITESELCLNTGSCTDGPVNGLTAACAAISVDSVAPVIDISDLTVVATGYVTDVSIPASATDGNDGEVTVTPDQAGPFRPGSYTISYSSEDSACNLRTAELKLDVLPLVTLAGATVTGEGRAIAVPFSLNGSPVSLDEDLTPTYPVTLDYIVSGVADSSDHDLAAGTVNIDDGTAGSLTININEDMIAEADEEFTITLTGTSANAALSNAVEYRVLIVETNVEPAVSLSTVQSGISSQSVYKSEGVVVITANGSDPNGDVLTYDWTPTDADLGGTDNGNQYIFGTDGALPAAGSYHVGVVVSDGSAQIKGSTTIVIADETPILLDCESPVPGDTDCIFGVLVDADNDGLSNLTEGRQDLDADGLVDYLDPMDDPTLLNARVLATQNNYARPIRSNAGVALVLGEVAISAQRNGARIIASDVKDASGQTVADDGFVFIGGVFDFEVHGLSRAQRSATVVLPLTQSIPPNASYRKYSNNVWSTFVGDATDTIRSASSVGGECPPPGDASYQAGLIAFVDCVELTLTDGGPNDSDGEANGVIRDPGGVAIASQIPGSVTDPSGPVPPTSGPKGGGAFGWLFLLLLSMGMLFRYRKTEVISK